MHLGRDDEAVNCGIVSVLDACPQIYPFYIADRVTTSLAVVADNDGHEMHHRTGIYAAYIVG
jgi:hypothetical protein